MHTRRCARINLWCTGEPVHRLVCIIYYFGYLVVVKPLPCFLVAVKLVVMHTRRRLVLRDRPAPARNSVLYHPLVPQVLHNWARKKFLVPTDVVSQFHLGPLLYQGKFLRYGLVRYAQDNFSLPILPMFGKNRVAINVARVRHRPAHIFELFLKVMIIFFARPLIHLKANVRDA